MEEIQNLSWYKRITISTNTLAEELELNEHQTDLIRQHVITIARDQYKAGNNSGIKWIRKQLGSQK